MAHPKIEKLLGIDNNAVRESARTAVATVISLLLARALKFPEYYWAPISTVVILQSTIHPLQGAWQRFVGTALGATLGAVVATFIGHNAIIYAIGIFVCGILAAVFRAWSAYRVAAITFSIVVLISRGPAWVFAWHRFLEVSLGIAVALVATLVSRPTKKSVAQT
jgi:uncharacterized membrane protein YgaE (UPF0421/DUF939 family)